MAQPSASAAPRVYSLWIYSPSCTLIYHADWAGVYSDAPASARTPRAAGATLLPGVSRAVAAQPGSAEAAAQQLQLSQSQQQQATSSRLPLDEEAKLVYGVVFSLRNMARKLNGPQEVLNSFSTPQYTLSHLQTPTFYTFVLITSPLAPPRAASAGGGGGIPGTGGMSSTGVLQQLWRGPWQEHVVRNPAVALERTRGAAEEGDVKEERRRGVDNDAFREGVERVFAQNKLLAPSA